MTEEAKQFIFALDQCRGNGGMYWHGHIPHQIVELFDIKISEINSGYTIAGVHVETVPQYTAYVPKWLENKA